MIEDKAFHDTKRRQSLDNSVVDRARKEEIEKLFSRPPPSVLSHALTVLLFDGLHHRFKLGAAFPKELTDKEIDKEIERLNRLNQCPPSCNCSAHAFKYT